jgi:hypothetical protein
LDQAQTFLFEKLFSNELKMSVQVEIFQDAAVYTAQIPPSQDLVVVPLDTQDVSAFAATSTATTSPFSTFSEHRQVLPYH